MMDRQILEAVETVCVISMAVLVTLIVTTIIAMWIFS